ncbi:MAG: carboxypeptidase-like regulatory domain-containing protein [Bacteroidales bacterium]|nr:carboxypeptidase-like regulatory domain-containing protein [Bacteroidales bacterium]
MKLVNLIAILIGLLLLPSFAISKRVYKGTVIDKHSSKPVEGANIIVLEDTRGASTDHDGFFKLKIREKDVTVMVRHVSYKRKMVDLKYEKDSNFIIEIEKDTLLVDLNIRLGEYTGPKQYERFNENTYQKRVRNMKEDFPLEDFNIVERRLAFYGGWDNLLVFFASHFKYPKPVLDQNLEGSAIINFTVNKQGHAIISGISIKCDKAKKEIKEELMRVLNQMPRWYPARQRGKEVPMRLQLKVLFAANAYGR